MGSTILKVCDCSNGPLNIATSYGSREPIPHGGNSGGWKDALLVVLTLALTIDSREAYNLGMTFRYF